LAVQSYGIQGRIEPGGIERLVFFPHLLPV
jgi:hypothetical protein